MKAAGRRKAIDAFTEGYTVAAERGDYMPKTALAERLNALGALVPEVEDPDAKAARIAADDPNAILDRRTGAPQAKLEKPPIARPDRRLYPSALRSGHLARVDRHGHQSDQ